MSKTIDAKYDAMRDELIAHAAAFPLGQDHDAQREWGTTFDLIRQNIERLKYAKEHPGTLGDHTPLSGTRQGYP